MPPGLKVTLDSTSTDVVVFAVSNRGAIPEHILPHLFDPFRGGNLNAGRTYGLGLGLYIVSQIVQAHYGRVDVDSGTAGETSFRVALPRAEF